MRQASTWIGCACVVLGCAGEPSEARPAPLAAPAAVGVTRPDIDPVATSTPPAARPAPEHAWLGLHAIAATDAEDGRGNVVASAAPVALDLDAHAFPPRALDPVLTIGTLELRHYAHPRIGVLRFVLSDASLLAAGDDVRVHFLEDASDVVRVTTLTEADVAAARQP